MISDGAPYIVEALSVGCSRLVTPTPPPSYPYLTAQLPPLWLAQPTQLASPSHYLMFAFAPCINNFILCYNSIYVCEIDGKHSDSERT